MKIRQMKFEDIKDVQHVVKTSWHDTYEGIIPINIQNDFLKSAYSHNSMQKRLDSSTIYIATINEDVVGFANFYNIKNNEQLELSAIYIHPDFQGKGVGSALLQKGIDDIKGVRKIYINVEKENHKGRTFYISNGFETVEELEENFSGHILHTLRMVLNV